MYGEKFIRVLWHQFFSVNSNFENISSLMYIEAKLNVISGYDK